MRLLALMLVLSASIATAHSGRTDSSGGHFNRRTGSYHYHGSGRSTPTYRTASRTAARSTPRTVYRTSYRSSGSTEVSRKEKQRQRDNERAAALRRQKEERTAAEREARLEAERKAEREKAEKLEREKRAAEEKAANHRRMLAKAKNLLRFAKAMSEKGDKAGARRYLQRLLKECPTAPEAAEARSQLGLVFRTWRDSTGGFEVQAIIIAVSGTVVTLEKLSGDQIRVPIPQLSDSDQQYVRTIRDLIPQE